MTEEYEPGGMPSSIQYLGDEYREISLEVGGTFRISLDEIRTLENMDLKEIVIHPNCRCSTVPEDKAGGGSNV